MKITWHRVCSLLAAKNCYESGVTIKAIAQSAKKSQSTIRRWLKQSGVK